MYRIRTLVLPIKVPANPILIEYKRNWTMSHKDRIHEYNKKTNRSVAHDRAVSKYKKKYRMTESYRAKAREYMKKFRMLRKEAKLAVDKDYQV